MWSYTQSIPCRIGPILVDLYSINTKHNQTNSCGFILDQYHAESDQFVWIYTQSIPCRIGQFVWIYTQYIPCINGPIRVDLNSINTMQNQTNSCGFVLIQYHAESDQFVWIYTESIPCIIGQFVWIYAQ